MSSSPFGIKFSTLFWSEKRESWWLSFSSIWKYVCQDSFTFQSVIRWVSL